VVFMAVSFYSACLRRGDYCTGRTVFSLCLELAGLTEKIESERLCS